MHKIVLAVVAVVSLAGSALAGPFDTPYTFGMAVQVPKLSVVDKYGSITPLMSVKSGTTTVFAITPSGVALSAISGDGSALTGVVHTESDPVVKAINGLVKSDGSVISAAAAGTDYQLPLVAGTDYQTPLVAGTDYQTPLVAGTDYLAPDGDGSALTNITSTNIAAGALTSVTDLSASGDVHLGAAETVSTITAAGVASFHGSVSSGGTVTAAAVNISGNGQMLFGNATSVQLGLLVPNQAIGAAIVNSDTNELCLSSAAVVGSWVKASSVGTSCY